MGTKKVVLNSSKSDKLEEYILVIASIIAGIFVANSYNTNDDIYGIVGSSFLAFIVFYLIFKLLFGFLEVLSSLLYPVLNPLNSFSELVSKSVSLDKIKITSENFWKSNKVLSVLIIIVLYALLFLMSYWLHSLNWVSGIFFFSLFFYSLIFNIFNKL